ncbi:MAG: hypothetical protein IJ213_06105 [Bacteroidales bacterium]|nr:hypothetical protein [Bacteroidales bacterium]
MKHYLVTKNIENIGKEAYKLSEEFKANHKEILWKKIILLRENTNITPKRLYRIATEDKNL